MSKSKMNDTATMVNYTGFEENYQQWKDRYRTAPSISPEGLPTAGGQGFIDYERIGRTAAQEQLADRKHELDHSHGPDKERLQLLYAAEKLHNETPGSRRQAREAFGQLVEYDLDHGHPIADRSRDLHIQPYTPEEQSNWHRRDGRELTSREQEKANDLDWRNPLAYQVQPQPISKENWWLHPGAEPVIQEQRRIHELGNAEALSVELSNQVPKLDGERLQKQRTMQP